MGLRTALRLASVTDIVDEPDVVAAVGGPALPAMQSWYYDGFMTRDQAMTIPAVARARNIMCGVAASLGFERYSRFTGQELSRSPFLDQPDPASPASVTWSWLADSILFYGVGYLQILSVFAEDGRPRQARWINPTRVAVNTNADGTLITGYSVDGTPVPVSGVGSLIDFPGIDEGILKRGARVLRTAFALENAAYNAAMEPTPPIVLKNNGPDLPGDKVTDLLTKWKQARQQRATAYLANGIDMEAVGFDPRAQQLVESRAFHAGEIAKLCGLPAWYLGAETNSMTYSNTENERRSLIDFSIRPMLLAPIEQRLSMFDVTPQGIEVKADLDGFLRGNAIERADVLVKLTGAGIMTIEEAREREDLIGEGTPTA